MKVMISQSNYVPWHGFFAAIRAVDLYVILDTVQFTRRDWRSRNRIQFGGKDRWLTVPVSGSRNQRINEVLVTDSAWPTSHLGTLKAAYRAQMDDEVSELAVDLYSEVEGMDRLTDINQHLIHRVSQVLGIDTRIIRCEGLPDSSDPSRRLALIAEAVGAKEYWSGPAARNYMAHEPFDSAGISVNYFDLGRVRGAAEDRAAGHNDPYSILHDLATLGTFETQRRTAWI